MRLLTVVMVLLLLGFVSRELVAAQNKVLSLKDCIEIALKNNSQLQISQHQLSLAKRNYQSSFRNILPTVNFSYSMNKYERGPTFYIGNEYVGPNPFTDKITRGRNYSADISISQNIFDGGFWWNNIRKTRSDQTVQQFSYFSQRQNTIVNVQEKYFALLRELKLLEVYRQAVQRSQDQLDRAQSMYELGSVAQVDVYRARVNLGNDRIQYLTQKNIVEKARQDLNIAMGRNPQEPLEIETQIEFQRPMEKLDNLIERALQTNPDLRQLEQSRVSARLETRLAASNFLPRLNAFYVYSRRVPQFEGLYKDFSREYSWFVGMQISWNLFNGFNDYLSVQKAKINEKITSEQLLESRRQIMSTVKSLYDDLVAYDEIIQINRENLKAAQEEYRLAEERYRVGAGTALELREAQVNLTRAEQIVVSAEYNAIITYSRLQAAVGDLLNAY